MPNDIEGDNVTCTKPMQPRLDSRRASSVDSLGSHIHLGVGS